MFSFRKLLFPILYFRKWKKKFFHTNYHLFFLIQSHICRVQSDLDLILDHFLTKWSDRRSLYCNTPDRDLDLILDHFLTKWSWTDRRSEKKWSCNSLQIAWHQLYITFSSFSRRKFFFELSKKSLSKLIIWYSCDSHYHIQSTYLQLTFETVLILIFPVIQLVGLENFTRTFRFTQSRLMLYQTW